ncbi:hypothetical protein [Idiomarina piscisalsi]|uniref:hypothetical protein n=1 Tax=Idiomarina piscisalsi TaxID=1096243 RepID=UPI00130019D0|nr:hypothetical protein [Idiomarina piscisalsi]
MIIEFKGQDYGNYSYNITMTTLDYFDPVKRNQERARFYQYYLEAKEACEESERL